MDLLFRRNVGVELMPAESSLLSAQYQRFRQLLAIAIVLCSVPVLTGCTDGPLFQMKRLSPWHQREWSRDRQLGPTFTQRLAELELLRNRIASMSNTEKQQWAGTLSKIVTDDTSPEMRARAAQVLAMTEGDAAISGLNSASTDQVEKVRLAACRAWGMRKDNHARDMLMSMAKTDDSDDVRQAALASLGKYEDPEVRQMMIEALDDKNPAIQHQAVVALRTMTRKDFGGDFELWKRYLGGETVEEPKPSSFTARAMQSIPWMK